MKEQIGAKDAGVCDWDDYTVINQTGKLKDGALRIIFDCGYDESCWNEASCTTLLCVPERIRGNIGAIPSIIKSCFS